MKNSSWRKYLWTNSVWRINWQQKKEAENQEKGWEKHSPSLCVSADLFGLLFAPRMTSLAAGQQVRVGQRSFETPTQRAHSDLQPLPAVQLNSAQRLKQRRVRKERGTHPIISNMWNWICFTALCTFIVLFNMLNVICFISEVTVKKRLYMDAFGAPLQQSQKNQ